MKFDAMAAAVDWLDAYRFGDIEAILRMYRDDTVTECGCDGVTIVGKDGRCELTGNAGCENIRRRNWTT